MVLLRKIYLAIIIFAVVGIAYTFATSKNLYLSSGTFSPPASSEIAISVSKMNVHYGDMEAWSAKGLPPGADYVNTIRFENVALILGGSRANVNGEANGSFLIGGNIPPGIFRIAVAVSSDPEKLAEVSVNLEP